MRRFYPFVLTALLLFVSSSVSAQGPALTITDGSNAGRPVFPADVPLVRAFANFTATAKVRAEFKWTAPSGRLHSTTFKTLFPNKSGAPAAGWDTLPVAGTPASEETGWWTVEAGAAGEKLSGRFFLTKSRHIMDIARGGIEGRKAAVLALDLKDPEARDAIGIATQDKDDEVRTAAMEALSGHREGWPYETLAAGQDDPSPSVRVAALKSLRLAGFEAGLKAAARAADDPSPSVRKAAAENIGIAPDGMGREVAAKLLEDKDPEVREAALLSLSALDGQFVVETLSKGFGVDDTDFRKQVLSVLAMKKAPGKTEALLPGLRDPDPEIRFRTLRAVAEKGGPAEALAARPLMDDVSEKVASLAFDTVSAEGDVSGLEAAVSSKYPGLRAKAVGRLAAMRDGAGAKGLAAAMKDEDPAVRRAALKGLKLSGRQGVPGLLEALRDKETDIRSEAASALEALGVGEAEGAMLNALSDPQPSVKYKALGYFIEKGGPALPGVLGRLACDQDQGVRAAALSALSKIKGEASSKALTEFMPCGDLNIRQAVVDVLAGRDDDAAVEGLTAALSDGQAAIRIKAASRLLLIGGRAPVGALYADPEPGVRRLAVAAMGVSPGPEMLPALAALSKDNDEDVRLAALDVLGGIPGPEAGGAISAAYVEGSGRVRERTRGLLLSRGDEGVVQGVLAVFSEGGPDVRIRALSALSSIKGALADEALLKAFQAGAPEEKSRALHALADRGSKLFTGALGSALSDESIMLRSIALDMAKTLPEIERDPVFLDAVSSGYYEVREAGLKYFDGKAGETAVKAFLAASGDGLPMLRKKALDNLARLGGPSLPGLLLKAARDPDQDVRLAAFGAALALKDTEEMKETLLGFADGPDPALRVAAFDALLPAADRPILPLMEREFNRGYRREDIVRAAASIEGDEAVDLLARAYKGAAGDERLRMQITAALTARGGRALPALTEALQDPSVRIRVEAVRGIGQAGPPDKARLLGGAMTDPDERVRGEALAALRKTEGAEAIKAMLPALSDPDFKNETLGIILGRKEPERLSLLAERARAMEGSGFRTKVISAVFAAGPPTALVAGFADDPSFDVRYEAARTLAARQGGDAVSGLLVIAGFEDPRTDELAEKGISGAAQDGLMGGIRLLFGRGDVVPASVRFASRNMEKPDALKELVAMSAPDPRLLDAALEPLVERPRQAALPAMLEGLKPAGTETRRRLLGAIAGTGGPGTANALMEAYSAYPESRPDVIKAACENGRADDVLAAALGEADVSLRRAAAECLARSKDAAFTARALGDADEEVRLAATAAAGEKKNAGALMKAAADRSARVRKAAARGLARTEDKKIFQTLGPLALDKDDAVSDEALGALKGFGPAASSGLWGDLAGPRSRKPVRLAALAALGERREATAAGVFVGVLNDPDPDVAKAGLEGLRGLKEASLPALHPLLKDAKLRPAALALIGEFGNASSEEPLLAALPRMDEGEKEKAAAALGRFGGPGSVEAMSGLYREGGPQLKAAVARGLGGMKLKGSEPPVVQTLSDALTSPHDLVRFYAAYSVGRLKVKALKERVAAQSGVEKSSLVKTELQRALGLLPD